MDFDQAKQQALEHVIAEIWPGTAKRGEGDLMRSGRVHAIRILTAEQSLPMETGKFVDRDKFKKLIPALKTVCQAFSEISEQGKTALRWHADLMEARSDRQDALVEFEDRANRLLEAARTTMKATDGMTVPPDKRTNSAGCGRFRRLRGDLGNRRRQASPNSE